MSESLTGNPGAGESRPHARRTRLLSRPADQFRTSLIPTLGAAVLLVLLLAAVHQINARETGSLMTANPAFADALEAQSLSMETTFATGAIFYLFGLLAVGLIHSRRLMGALFALHRRIRQLGEGDLSPGFRLRRGDYFHDVAESLNETVACCQSRAREDLADVDDMISILERSPHAGPLRDGLICALEEMRDRKRDLLGMREREEIAGESETESTNPVGIAAV